MKPYDYVSPCEVGFHDWESVATMEDGPRTETDYICLACGALKSETITAAPDWDLAA